MTKLIIFLGLYLPASALSMTSQFPIECLREDGLSRIHMIMEIDSGAPQIQSWELDGLTPSILRQAVRDRSIWVNGQVNVPDNPHSFSIQIPLSVLDDAVKVTYTGIRGDRFWSDSFFCKIQDQSRI